ncbi:NAD(P)H-binding protein [Actinomyces radicidentis]|uniref:SDR family oxidoreductase n=1 Tax=Actinomyces radicidentis TaxID=111015 RepID=UPI0028E7D7DA|nr:NAD(P)H-binding protein [Actinomyces radicidentis]
MRIAVIGATGTAGRPTVRHSEAAGHDVRALCRPTGVDLLTGDGLAEAFDAVISAARPVPTDAPDVIEALTAVTERIVRAAEGAGVRHLVDLSIAGIDDPGLAGFDYYRAKLAEEDVIADSSVPGSIVRSAQRYEFALNPAAVEEDEDEVRVQDWYVQPLDVDAVGAALVAAAEAEPRDVALGSGDEPLHLPDPHRPPARGDRRRAPRRARPAGAAGSGLGSPPGCARGRDPRPHGGGLGRGAVRSAGLRPALEEAGAPAAPGLHLGVGRGAPRTGAPQCSMR